MSAQFANYNSDGNYDSLATTAVLGTAIGTGAFTAGIRFKLLIDYATGTWAKARCIYQWWNNGTNYHILYRSLARAIRYLIVLSEEVENDTTTYNQWHSLAVRATTAAAGRDTHLFIDGVKQSAVINPAGSYDARKVFVPLNATPTITTIDLDTHMRAQDAFVSNAAWTDAQVIAWQNSNLFGNNAAFGGSIIWCAPLNQITGVITNGDAGLVDPVSANHMVVNSGAPIWANDDPFTDDPFDGGPSRPTRTGNSGQRLVRPHLYRPEYYRPRQSLLVEDEG